MSTRAQAGPTGSTALAPPQAGRFRALVSRPWNALRTASLARRFLAANLVILLVAGVTVGAWVGNEVERSILDRTTSVTALFVESIVEPSVASMAEGAALTPDEIATLDGHLASSPLSDRVRSLRLWSRDGTVVYSPDAELIGRTFPIEGNLARAWDGEVVSAMDDLSGAENAWERARWSRLLEMYIPVRERGSDRIIGVAEFYLPPREIDQQVASARQTTWLLVSLAIIVAAVLLFGLVKRGSDTIERQEAALTRQVEELTDLLEQNALLSERVHTAAQRTTTLNERTMRRVSSDLHDGAGQMLSLALLRVDGLRKRAAEGRPATPDELAEIETALQEAMTDMRSVAAGLRVPELAPLEAEAVATRAIRDHERRADARVELIFQGLPRNVPLPVKIALFRALQESLSNATRHGQSQRIEVQLHGTPALRPGTHGGLELRVRDDGTGFDPATLASSEGLGLAGIREQAEILGGSFSLRSARGTGTELRVWWPVEAEAAEEAAEE